MAMHNLIYFVDIQILRVSTTLFFYTFVFHYAKPILQEAVYQKPLSPRHPVMIDNEPKLDVTTRLFTKSCSTSNSCFRRRFFSVTVNCETPIMVNLKKLRLMTTNLHLSFLYTRWGVIVFFSKEKKTYYYFITWDDNCLFFS